MEPVVAGKAGHDVCVRVERRSVAQAGQAPVGVHVADVRAERHPHEMAVPRVAGGGVRDIRAGGHERLDHGLVVVEASRAQDDALLGVDAQLGAVLVMRENSRDAAGLVSHQGHGGRLEEHLDPLVGGYLLDVAPDVAFAEFDEHRAPAVERALVAFEVVAAVGPAVPVPSVRVARPLKEFGRVVYIGARDLLVRAPRGRLEHVGIRLVQVVLHAGLGLTVGARHPHAATGHRARAAPHAALLEHDDGFGTQAHGRDGREGRRAGANDNDVGLFVPRRLRGQGGKRRTAREGGAADDPCPHHGGCTQKVATIQFHDVPPYCDDADRAV